MTRNLLLMIMIISLFVGCKNQTAQGDEDMTKMEEPRGADNVAYKWGKIALEATANDTEMFKPRPTISSRFLGLIFVSVFDAWSAYDEKAVPVYLEGVEKRPTEEQTLKNKEIAISYAAYTAMCEYYYTDKPLFDKYMKEMGYDPMDTSMDPTTPVGIGNLAAKSVIEARKGDGSNQYAEVEGSNGIAYFDYTNYEPVHGPDENVDLAKWQPKYFDDGKGGKVAPGCLTAHWSEVKPVSLKSGDQFRPGPPPAIGSKELEEQVKEVVELQANLTDEQRALVEFMRDGPQSVQQAGHWLKFAQEVSIRDNHTLDEDVKMYFLNQVVAMDAFIASWDSKMFYDYARPYALVHEQYKGKTIHAWAGPDKGWVDMPGEEWRPYSPGVFLCPPFPSYTSGHSTISGACAEALKLYTGSDEFGSSVDLVPGILTEPNNLGDTVTIQFPTFSETANLAGKSRVMGGYHIEADNIAGLELGRDVAQESFRWYKKHVGEM